MRVAGASLVSFTHSFYLASSYFEGKHFISGVFFSVCFESGQAVHRGHRVVRPSSVLFKFLGNLIFKAFLGGLFSNFYFLISYLCWVAVKVLRFAFCCHYCRPRVMI